MGLILLHHFGTIESAALSSVFYHMAISYVIKDGERTRDAETCSALSILEFGKPGTL